MRNLVAVVVALVTGVAHADVSTVIATESFGGGESVAASPTRLAIGHVRRGDIDRTHVRVVDTEDGPHLRWTLQVSSPARSSTEVIVPLVVPRHVAIVGFELAITGQPAFEAIAVTRSHARAHYETLTRQVDDPALLEIVASGDTSDTLQLRVFPIARGAPGTVVIDMAIPGGNQLIVDPGPRAIAVGIEDSSRSATWNASVRLRTWPVHSSRGDKPVTAVLTRATSLVAGPWIQVEAPVRGLYAREQFVPTVVER